MKRYFIYTARLLILCLVVVLTTGCQKKENEAPVEIIIEETSTSTDISEAKESSVQQEESKDAVVEESSSSEEIEPAPADNIIHDTNMNPLTGEIEDHPVSSKRPVAFSINNHPDAVPAVGISDADIIYEGIIEGGATRMLAVFQEVPNNDIPIGSIRSLRHNYIDFAACYDAIIVHCGCSNIATNELERRDYSDIDAISWAGGLFYRDSWRDSNMGYVHSLVTTGEDINEFLKSDAPFRVEHESDYECNMLFSNEPVVVGGNIRTEINVFFGDYRNSIFTFEADTNDYIMEEYGDTYIDYNTGNPIHFKNLVVIKTDVWVCDDQGHQDMTLTGEGEGYFAVNGVCAPIKWSRSDEDAQFVLTYADGSPVIFGVGKTYIAIVNMEGGIQ